MGKHLIPRNEPNRPKYHLVCYYCGDDFMCSRPDAHTCGNVCRGRLHDFRKRYGVAVFSPLGLKSPPRSRQAREVARAIRQVRR